MSLFDGLEPTPAPGVTGVPKGWEPYAEEAGQVGSAIVRLPRPNATKRDLLVAAGFDPDCWQISGNIQVRRWMRYDQEWLYYYRFDTVEAESDEQYQANVDELAGLIRRRPPRGVRSSNATDAYLFGASDWQVGKGEADGTTGTVQRVLDSIERSVARVKDLRRVGRKMPELCIAGTGDLGEGTCGFYPNQLFTVDCTRREQNRLVRMLLTTLIDEHLPLFDKVTVLTVGGNHGENRQDGKRNTDDSDNDDVAQFECVREAFDRTGAPIDWVIPQGELSLLHRVAGVPIGFTHGHLFGRGGIPQAKAEQWWKNQDFGFQAVREAQILVSSHFHHFTASTFGARTHVQTPAMDPGSKWVRDAWGSDSPAGVLTLRIDPTEPLSWADLAILGA